MSGGRGQTERAAAAVTVEESSGSAAALQHVDVIAGEIRRLDEVVQGFSEIHATGGSQAAAGRPRVARRGGRADRAAGSRAYGRVGGRRQRTCPDVNGDPAMLRQAFLNLALNACQAMPNGGTLQIRCEAARGRRVAVSFSDSGVGIKPEHLERIFDLYFTTKPKGQRHRVVDGVSHGPDARRRD